MEFWNHLCPVEGDIETEKGCACPWCSAVEPDGAK